MLQPCKPINEKERLNALLDYHILDTDPEKEFDEITKLASQICETPVSLISFIDPERQWFKSHYGLNVSETDRDIAFCAHAINEPNDIFIVPDSRLDSRFSDNPLVQSSPNIVFYAGMPLLNPEGHALGTLCIIDFKPKQLSESQISALRTLCNQVIKLLELRKKNFELEEKKERLDKLVELYEQTSEVAKIGGWEIDLQNKQLYWSSTTKKIHEVEEDYTPDVEYAINFYKPGKDRDIITGFVIDAIERGKNYEGEFEIITAKGNKKWIKTKGNCEIENNRCVRVFGIFQDITEEKRKDLKLSLREAQFKKSFHHASIGMALISTGGRCLKVNQSICTLLGYTEQEMLKLSIRDIIFNDDLQDDLVLLKKLVTGDLNNYSEERRFYHKNGKIIWVILSVTLIREEDGSALHFIAQITNINEKKLAEVQVENERKLLLTLIDHLPVNIFIKDIHSRKILVNQKEIEHMGLNDETEILGKTDFELYPEQSALVSIEEDLYILKSGESIINKETYNTKLDGTNKWFLTSKIPLRNEENEITSLLGISCDITDSKIKEKKLSDLLETSKNQNQRLQNFAHIVSHNLRTHAGNFEKLLDFLKTETNPEERNTIENMLHKASKNLSETVIHLNEIVSAESSEKTDSDIYLNEAIKQVQNNLSGLLQDSKVEIINEVEETMKIKAVPAYLESILLNFMTNGIKYKSKDRHAYVKFKAMKDEDHLVLSIEDNGIGIDLEKNKDKMFGMYKTFHGNKDAQGIGLYITKNQIESMGGKVEVDSAVGKGTTFKIIFNLN